MHVTHHPLFLSEGDEAGIPEAWQGDAVSHSLSGNLSRELALRPLAVTMWNEIPTLPC